MLAPITHVLPLTHLRRARMLPVKGRVLVTEGQVVTPTEAVAEAFINKKHIMLDIRSILKTSSRSKARRAISRKAGEHVEEGDVIASSGGMFNRVLIAPASGVIAAIAGGKVLLQMDGNPFVLRAGYPGTVTAILPDRGVIL